MLALRRILSDSTPGLRPKVIGLYGALIAITIFVWALTILAGIRYPLLLPLAITAYGFGLRHAVDADHISAIDNVTRKLMQERKKPVGVGLFFSLGHSTVVFVLAALIAAGSAIVRSNIENGGSTLETVGGFVGTLVSAVFLIAIAIMNLVILVEIVRAFRSVTRSGAYNEAEVDVYLSRRGFFARIFRGLFKTVDTSWKMYPIGFLFGLGFDTATEIGLLALSGSFATQHVPFYVVLLLPLLFTSGMTFADSTDGVLMLGAYGWAFVKPIRKLFYNLSITTVSVIVAFGVGGLETLSIIQSQLGLKESFWGLVGNLNGGSVTIFNQPVNNFELIGGGIIGIFLLSWLISTLIYRINRYDDLPIGPPGGAKPAMALPEDALGASE